MKRIGRGKVKTICAFKCGIIIRRQSIVSSYKHEID